MEIKFNESTPPDVQNGFLEFQSQVQSLLARYRSATPDKMEKVEEKLKQTNGNWDIGIKLNSQNIDVSLLLAYEYCLAAERMTNGQVSFDAMLDRLFSTVQKFRIGNPEPSDSNCLYGKGFSDPTAVPVTSKAYRMLMNAGAQHLNYYNNGEFMEAVFIYKKQTIKSFGIGEDGKPIDLEMPGIDFDNLSDEQSLLNNLRQTVFHEWTHSAEKEVIDPTDSSAIPYEYVGDDGKKYRNYEKIEAGSHIYTHERDDTSEPSQYYFESDQISSSRKIKRDRNGQAIGYYYENDAEKTDKVFVNEQRFFKLKEIELSESFCYSTGLSTQEILPNGRSNMLNMLTEGMVEHIARTMIKTIDPETLDIDEGKYSEYVEMASRVVEARDASIENGAGKTYADFLTHSSILKQDLENRRVGKVDGLHYLTDYAMKIKRGETKRRKFFKKSDKFKLSDEQKDTFMALVAKKLDDKEITEEEMSSAKDSIGLDDLESWIDELVQYTKEEQEFFDGIGEKLGYVDKHIEQQEGKDGKDGVEDCLDDETIRTSTVREATDFIRRAATEKQMGKEEVQTGSRGEIK